MLSIIRLLFICVLASRALAQFAQFNITVNKQNYTTTQILDVPDGKIKTACATNCTAASTQLQACNNDPKCLCRADTVETLRACEQCMFTELVTLNQKTDFRVGSQAVLAGYAAACNDPHVNISVAATQTALKLPANWDGPVVSVLPVGGAVITVITAIFLGVSGLFVVCNM